MRTGRAWFCASAMVAVAACSSSTTGTAEKPKPCPPNPDGKCTASGDCVPSQIRAEIEAVADEKSVYAEAALTHEGRFLALTFDDRLFASFDDGTTIERNEMAEARDGAVVRYRASRALTRPASVRVVVEYVRTCGRLGAPLSETRVPEAFELRAPPNVRYGQGISLELSNVPSDYPTLEVAGPCIAPYKETLPITKRAQPLVVGALDTSKIQRTGALPCTLSGQVRFEARGQVDSAFARGPLREIDSMDAVRVRRFEIVLE